jgi:hypothetical protein
MELALRFLDRHVVDARETSMHEAVGLEFPVLVPIRTEPVPSVVMPLVRIPNCDAVFSIQPQLFDEPVVKLLFPLSLKESLGLGSAVGELRNPGTIEHTIHFDLNTQSGST